jgi:hypothetical protein
MGADNDGNKVALLTTEQLVNEDRDATNDVYIYDFERPLGNRLILASKGDETAPSPGVGGRVLGVTVMSQDGSRLYFVAQGVLTTHPNAFGAVAESGANNFYAFDPDTGEMRFISKLAAGDSRIWLQFAPLQLPDDAGHVAIFTSQFQISPDDVNAVADVYRYDSVTGGIVKITPSGNTSGVSISGGVPGSKINPNTSQASADGSLIAFVSSNPLQLQDGNGVEDIYAWADGEVFLVSGAAKGAFGGPGSPANSPQIDDGGKQIAFRTPAGLVPEDGDTVISAYVARYGPDIDRTAIVPKVDCEANDSCRGASIAPPDDPAPASPDFVGPPNQATPKPLPGKKPAKPKPKKQQKKKKKAKGKAKSKAQSRSGVGRLPSGASR